MENTIIFKLNTFVGKEVESHRDVKKIIDETFNTDSTIVFLGTNTKSARGPIYEYVANIEGDEVFFYVADVLNKHYLAGIKGPSFGTYMDEATKNIIKKGL